MQSKDEMCVTSSLQRHNMSCYENKMDLFYKQKRKILVNCLLYKKSI